MTLGEAHPSAPRTSSTRAAGPTWDAVRDLTTAWLSRVASDGRADLVGRLRSPDDNQFRSAFWELYLHEALLASGFDVAIHPTLPGTTRQPDFLAGAGDTSFYLEAKVLDEEGPRRRGGRLAGAAPDRPAQQGRLPQLLAVAEDPIHRLKGPTSQGHPAEAHVLARVPGSGRPCDRLHRRDGAPFPMGARWLGDRGGSDPALSRRTRTGRPTPRRHHGR